MSRGASDRGGSPGLTADECVRAGMYWFGRSDLAAAEAWWRRALELDPAHVRAHECLRLLARAVSSGTSSSSREASRGEAPAPSGGAAVPSTVELEPLSRAVDTAIPASQSFSTNTGFSPKLEPPPGTLESDRIPDDVWDRALQATLRPGEIAPDGAVPSSDPFDFARSASDDIAGDEEADSPPGRHAPLPPRAESTPWDDGPSRTSVVTLRDFGGPDAVAEPTPIPSADFEAFFGRVQKAAFGHPRDEEGIGGSAEIREGRSQAIEPSEDADLPIIEPIEEVWDESPGRSPADILGEAKDRFQLHDFNGALELLERIKEGDPGHAEARGLIAQSRANLVRMYESKIGDFDRSPHLLISSEEIIWLNLDHRAGFILSQIDGAVTYDDIIALSGMPRLDTLRILTELIQNRVIGTD